MKHITKLAGVALACASILFAAPASAQKEDEIDPAAVSAAVRYALPLVFEGYVTACFETLEADGFVTMNAPALREKFTDGAEASWPGARLFLLQVAREQGGYEGDTDQIGDDDLRAVLDPMIEEMAATEIKAEYCSDIEKALEIMDPLPADNLAAMFGFIVDLALRPEEVGTGFFDLEAAVDAEAEEQVMSESRARKLREQEEEEADNPK